MHTLIVTRSGQRNCQRPLFNDRGNAEAKKNENIKVALGLQLYRIF